jgi:hypothetical protein
MVWWFEFHYYLRRSVMNKIILFLAGVLAAITFTPEASALPAFARQTGMACNACHAQHFPVLNSFGRAFKASGYTLMGAQGRVDGENLSIPEQLNAAVLLKYRYQKDSTAGAASAGTTGPTSTSNGMWQMGDEFSLFFGGRIAESERFKVGFLMENNVANVGGAGNLIAGLRLPITYDAGLVNVSFIPFTTDMLGVTYSFELSSGGLARANRWSENRRETSAVQYNADQGGAGTALVGVNGYGKGAASGHAFVVHNDLFFVNYSLWSSSFLPGGNGGALASTNYGQRYIRAAATPSFAGFDFVAGIGKESGTSYGNLAGAQVEARQTFVDVQAQGEIAGLEAAFYFQNAKAPVCTAAITLAGNCVHNNGVFERKATTLGTEFGVIPHTLSVGLAYRKADNGGTRGFEDDNAINLSGVYEMFQNVSLHADYAKYSGSATNVVNPITYMYTLMLEAAW